MNYMNVAAGCLLVSLWTAMAGAAPVENLVGLPALAAEEDVAQELKLTDEQRTNLQALFDDIESKGLNAALDVKDLPHEEQEAKLAPFREESESKAQKILTGDQWRLLKKIRVRQMGMLSLGDANVAQLLMLSDEQKKDIEKLLLDRKTDLLKADARREFAVRADYERRLKALLEPAQYSSWEFLAGLNASSRSTPSTPTTPAPSTRTPVATTPPPVAPPVTAPPVAVPPVAAPTKAPPEVVKAPPTASVSKEPGKLTFKFRYQPWKDVLDWFAEKADLSLFMEAPPQGTFNYTDERSYTPEQALDVLNGALLTKGFTLVRRNKMLMLVNLEDGIPPNLVPYVPSKDIDQKGEFELISVLFVLEKMAPADAEAEIKKLLGPQGSVVVLPKARQIMVTETAGRLKTIRAVIEAIENPPTVTVDELKVFALEHATLDEAAALVRQMMDIPADRNATSDGSLRIALDPGGNKLLASGTPEKLNRVQELMKVVDVAVAGAEGPVVTETPQLEVYSVTSADPEAVLKVMQTLMAGLPDVRLATDPKTGNLVALARPSQHATIRATLEQMQRDASQVEVIRLINLDSQLAVLAINKLFGVEGEGAKANGPKVDADPASGSLMIRANAGQIAQIRQLLEKMGETGGGGSMEDAVASNIRMVPLPSRQAQSVLTQIEAVWPVVRKNKIRIVTPSTPTANENLRPGERPSTEYPPELLDELFKIMPPANAPTPPRPTPPTPTPTPPSDRTTLRIPVHRALFANKETEAAAEAAHPPTKADPQAAPAPAGEGSPILVVPGPKGLLIASEDLEALDRFESLLRSVAGSGLASGSDFTVFYLKHTTAAVAADTLGQVFGSSSGGGGGGGGGMMGGMLGDLAGAALGDLGGGLLGSLLGGGGGGSSASLSSGSVMIVPDARLNALIVQAAPTDLDTMEQLLEVIDQADTPETDVTPKPQMIPVKHNSAAQIAEIVKEVYRERISSSGGGQRQPSPEDFMRMLQGGRGGRSGGSSRGGASQEPAKMTLGVDARTNSLIVSAPQALFVEVRELVEMLDQASSQVDESMQVVTLRRTNPQAVSQALSAILGSNVTTRPSEPTAGSSSSSQTASNNSSSNQSSSDSDEATRRRIEFFRNLQSGGSPFGGGGSPFGGGRSSGGGSPFGGGGSPFGGGRSSGGSSGGRGR